MAKKKEFSPHISDAIKAQYPKLEEALSKPLTPDDVEWKKQMVYYGNTEVSPYVTNRFSIAVLMEVFGIGNIQNNLQHIPVKETTERWRGQRKDKEYYTDQYGKLKDKAVAVECEKEEKHITYGVVGSILVRVGNEWITLCDGAEQSDIEPFKGGISNAFKRALVWWFPPVMELYSYPKVVIEGDVKDIKDYAEHLSSITELYNKGKVQHFHKLVCKSDGIYLHNKKISGKNYTVEQEGKGDEPKNNDELKKEEASFSSIAAKVVGKNMTIEADGKMCKGVVITYSKSMKDAFFEYCKHNARKFIFAVKGSSGTLHFAQNGDSVVVIEPGEVDFFVSKCYFTLLEASMKATK